MFDVLKPTNYLSEELQRTSGKRIFPKGIPERLLRAVFTREVWLQGHPQWDSSWTNTSTYEAVIGSLNSITFTDFPDHEFYFEMVGFTDAGTGYWRLFNATDGVALEDSELSTTSTVPVRLRSAKIPKPSTTKSIIIEHKIVGGAGDDYVNSVMSRLVFRLP
jgi:hypothetical protein